MSAGAAVVVVVGGCPAGLNPEMDLKRILRPSKLSLPQQAEASRERHRTQGGPQTLRLVLTGAWFQTLLVVGYLKEARPPSSLQYCNPAPALQPAWEPTLFIVPGCTYCSCRAIPPKDLLHFIFLSKTVFQCFTCVPFLLKEEFRIQLCFLYVLFMMRAIKKKKNHY